MTELINQAVELFSQGKEILQEPQISGAVTGVFSFLKNSFSGNKRAKDRLEKIEKAEADEETINQLKTNLGDLLYDNQELQKQLAEKLAEVQTQMQLAGISNVTKTNTVNVSNSTKTVILQDVKGGDINITSS